MANNFVNKIDLDGEQWELHDTDLRNIFLGMVYPIGVTYLQFPQQKAPTELFPQFTWEQLDYGGAFFRSDGGNADSFINENETLTPQNQGTAKNGLYLTGDDAGSKTKLNTTKGHTHKVSSWLACFSGSSNYWVLQPDSYGSHDRAFNSNAYTGTDNLFLFSDDNETRPTNYTVKVWKRTA